MINLISKEIQNYVISHSADEPDLLKKLTHETFQKVLQPQMLSGHYQGRILSILSKIIRPKKILEIGTYTGYSALCLAEGLHEKGEIHTIDKNKELFKIQNHYFNKSPYSGKIHQYSGDAIEIIPKIDGVFDLVFIDADKPNYVKYFHLIIEKLRKGGVIISDNVLWSGKVINSIEESDESTKTLIEYNLLLKNDPRVESVMLPIRDGLTVSFKK